MAATGDVWLEAGRDLKIGAAQNTYESSRFEQTTKSGLGSTGNGISYGSSDQKATVHDSAVTQTGSLVGSTGGSVHLRRATCCT